MASVKYNNIYIKDSYSVIGPMEKLGQIRKFDMAMDDYYFGEKTFEKAEVKMQRIVIDNLLYRNGLCSSNIDLVIGGDLTNQIAITNYTLKNYKSSYLGIYNACATFPEGVIIGSQFLKEDSIKNIIILTSCHNLTAEKQFRYPVEYGAPKKITSTFTATASVGVLLTKEKCKVRVESSTIGRVVDKGIKDVNHMGAVMAPAAAEVLKQHLFDLNRKISYYDLIITGDLGEIGSKIFQEYIMINYNLKIKNYMDAGEEVFAKSQDINAGSSGPATLPLVLFNKVLKNSKYKKILIIGTGALHSPMLVNQKNSIPSIAHAISLEVL